MNEATLQFSRRRFLVTSVKASLGAAAALTLGPEVFELLDRLGPRRLLVPGGMPKMLFFPYDRGVSLAFHRDFFDLAMAPLPMPELHVYGGARNVAKTERLRRSLFDL